VLRFGEDIDEVPRHGTWYAGSQCGRPIGAPPTSGGPRPKEFRADRLHGVLGQRPQGNAIAWRALVLIGRHQAPWRTKVAY